MEEKNINRNVNEMEMASQRIQWNLFGDGDLSACDSRREESMCVSVCLCMQWRRRQHIFSIRWMHSSCQMNKINFCSKISHSLARATAIQCTHTYLKSYTRKIGAFHSSRQFCVEKLSFFTVLFTLQRRQSHQSHIEFQLISIKWTTIW